MKLLVFQHIDGEHPAAFGDHASAAKDTYAVVKWHKGDPVPDPSDFDMLLVMGGPMDVWEVEDHPWLTQEIQLIRDWVQAGKPYLGICLGHQLLAVAMGGACRKMGRPEIGILNVEQTTQDPALSPLPQRFDVMQWHGVEVSKLPENTTILARNTHCPVQAMRVGTNAVGVQFHPEITQGLVSDWMADEPNWRCAVDWLGSEETAQAFKTEAEAHVPTAMAQSSALYSTLRNT